MRVVLNGLAALKTRTGVGHHVADLFAALRKHDPASTFALYPGKVLGRAASAMPVRRTAGSQAADGASSGWLKRTVKRAAKSICRVHFGGFARTLGFDLYHEPNFVPFPSHLPTVVTVHDLSVLKYPDWHPADRVAMHRKQFLKGLDRAEHVIVVSEAVRRELIDELGCPKDRVTAVHNGIAAQYVPQAREMVAAIRAKWHLPAKFLLAVGTIEPRKNLLMAMRAYLELPASLRRECPFVLAGPWGWHSEPERELLHRTGADSGLRHLGYVPAAELPMLYAAARALIYPSHYEGFGLPPIEMLACGGAVIASTAEALVEVIGPHAEFVSPGDAAGWRNAMRRAAEDDAYLDRLRAGGRDWAVQYTWARAAERTVEVYRRVLSHSPADAERAALRTA